MSEALSCGYPLWVCSPLLGRAAPIKVKCFTRCVIGLGYESLWSGWHLDPRAVINLIKPHQNLQSAFVFVVCDFNFAFWPQYILENFTKISVRKSSNFKSMLIQPTLRVNVYNTSIRFVFLFEPFQTYVSALAQLGAIRSNMRARRGNILLIT